MFGVPCVVSEGEDIRKVRLAREFDALGVEPPEMEVPVEATSKVFRDGTQ